MKESLQNLTAFILDFGLKKPNKAISFTAIVEYNLNDNITSINANVQIVTSDNLATIYIISDLASNDLPDMFDAKEERITYVPMKWLVIKQPTGYISIEPKEAV
ncbi:hypothetical protein [Ferruginibacter albus]|uniref:hypothetical protein n=1 Tax=Ferruginibacter albus TaxID=2875540 RepID=UPI001CC5C4C1|nr:hypothetical protein [Ferruginibacter albus]UAY53328.1 hypothetical protein K9M53_06570 [Ferruginibacter albus]